MGGGGGGGEATTIATNKTKQKTIKTTTKLTTITKQNENCCVCILVFNGAVILFRFGRSFTIVSTAGAWVKISSGE